MVALPVEKKNIRILMYFFKFCSMSFLYTLTVTLTEAAEKQAEKMVIERVSTCLNSLNGDFSRIYVFPTE